MASLPHVTVGMPVASYPPLFSYNTSATPGSWGGYLPKLLRLVEQELREVVFDMVPIPVPVGVTDNLQQVVSGNVDMTIASLHQSTLLAFNTSELVFTSSIKETTYSGLVDRRRTPPSLFTLFDPLQPGLWGVIVASILLTAVVMVLVDAIFPVRAMSTSARSCLREHGAALLRTTYHAWAAMLGGEDHEWPTAPARILRLGLLFTVLIVNATYTANLAAFFTRPTFVLGGPTTLSELSSATACTVVEQPAAAFVTPHVGAVITPPPTFPLDLEQRMAWCHSELRRGTANILLFDRPVLLSYLLSHGGKGHCDTLADASWVSVVPDIWVFAVRGVDADFGARVSAALATVKNTPEFVGLQRDFFHFGRVCSDSSVGGTERVGLESMAGLFVIAAALMAIAIATAIMQRLVHTRRLHGSATAAPASPAGVAVVAHAGEVGEGAYQTDSELLLAILQKQRSLASVVERIDAAVSHTKQAAIEL